MYDKTKHIVNAFALLLSVWGSFSCITSRGICCVGYEWNFLIQNCTKCIPGFFGVNCSQICRFPSYGNDCQRVCKCEKRVCDVSRGCVPEGTGCRDGFHGQRCSQRCRYPSYGRKCQHQCRCSRHNCHFSNGCVLMEVSTDRIPWNITPFAHIVSSRVNGISYKQMFNTQLMIHSTKMSLGYSQYFKYFTATTPRESIKNTYLEEGTSSLKQTHIVILLCVSPVGVLLLILVILLLKREFSRTTLMPLELSSQYPKDLLELHHLGTRNPEIQSSATLDTHTAHDNENAWSTDHDDTRSCGSAIIHDSIYETCRPNDIHIQNTEGCLCPMLHHTAHIESQLSNDEEQLKLSVEVDDAYLTPV